MKACDFFMVMMEKRGDGKEEIEREQLLPPMSSSVLTSGGRDIPRQSLEGLSYYDSELVDFKKTQRMHYCKSYNNNNYITAKLNNPFGLEDAKCGRSVVHCAPSTHSVKPGQRSPPTRSLPGAACRQA